MQEGKIACLAFFIDGATGKTGFRPGACSGLVRLSSGCATEIGCFPGVQQLRPVADVVQRLRSDIMGDKNGENTLAAEQYGMAGKALFYFKLYAPFFRDIIFIAIFMWGGWEHYLHGNFKIAAGRVCLC